MSKVMNINTGQMEALEHFKKNGKDIQSNKLVLILLNKKPGVAVKCSLFSQHSVLGTGCRSKHLDDACAMQTWEPAEPGSPKMTSVSGWLRAAVAWKKTASF